jgi:hypothetical protein
MELACYINLYNSRTIVMQFIKVMLCSLKMSAYACHATVISLTNLI